MRLATITDHKASKIKGKSIYKSAAKFSIMESMSDLEDRLIKLDIAVHDILRSVKQNKLENEETELQSLRDLVRRIGSHRIDDKDTTMLIREMRDKSYDI